MELVSKLGNSKKVGNREQVKSAILLEEQKNLNHDTGHSLSLRFCVWTGSENKWQIPNNMGVLASFFLWST
jgi:hypothetical protein